MREFGALLRRLRPAPVAIGQRERWRVSVGALLGIGASGALMVYLLPQTVGDMPWLAGPIGASAVLLFALPASPLAQPWPLLGGNVISALIGVSCARWIEPAWLAAAVAVAGAIAVMVAMRCLHPPGGATALTAVLGGDAIHAAGFEFVLAPVALNSLLLLFMALLFHNATGHRYPHALSATQPAAGVPEGEHGITASDIDFALEGQEELLDIDRADLHALLQRAGRHAWQRRLGDLCCADLVGRTVAAVNRDTPLEEAWHLMRRSGLKGLPVIDDRQRVIGIVTAADFMDHAGVGDHESLARRLRRFLRRTGSQTSDRPEVVGQIMTVAVQTVAGSAPVVELLPLFAASGHRQIPVLDGEQRLFGMLTQFDLITALFEHGLGPGAEGSRRERAQSRRSMA